MEKDTPAPGGGKPPSVAEARERSIVNFGTGVLTGAAISSVVPWHALESIAPSLRVSALAGVCAGFVLFRVVLRSKTMRRTSGLLCVIAGGFLMSSGQHLALAQVTSLLVAAGAAAFLCGITLLLRDRLPTRESREEAIRRILEEPAQNGAPRGAHASAGRDSTQPERDLEDSSGDLASLARGVGIRAPLRVGIGDAPKTTVVSKG